MAFWLFKEEPTHYSYADLERDGKAEWSGVSNALALIHLRQCKPKDRVFFYHTGKQKAIVGIMEILRGFNAKNGKDKEVAVTVRPIEPLGRPVTLSEIKQQKALAGWALVRMPRLSVMPVTPDQWQLVNELAAKPL